MAAKLIRLFRTFQHFSLTNGRIPIYTSSKVSVNNSKHLMYVYGRFCSSSMGNSSNIEPNIASHMEKCCAPPASSMRPENRNISVEKVFCDIGVSLEKVQKQMDITRLSLERVKEKIKILEDIGLKTDEIGQLLSRRPSVLVTRNETLQARIEALKKAGVRPDALMHAVRKAPGILTAKTEKTLNSKVNGLLSLPVKPLLTREEVLHILTKCPDIIASCSLKSIQLKITFFEKDLKFNQQQLRNIILKQPTVLTFSTDSMKSKFTYCYDQLNASRSSIARCPRLFQCSLQRIQLRHQFLIKVGRLKEEMIIDDYGLGVIITQTDKYFAEKVALSTLEEFNSFKISFSED